MSSGTKPIATGSQTIGPFFHVVPGCTEGLASLAAPAIPGTHIDLGIRVLDGESAPVPDALVELWQADAEGRYPAPGFTPGPAGFTGFGRLGTNEDGWAAFTTVRPGAVAGDAGGSQAPHINICVFARGLLRHLYTRMYFDGDPALANDPLLSIVPESRRTTLLAQSAGGDRWQFVIRLQGERETVFFDL